MPSTRRAFVGGACHLALLAVADQRDQVALVVGDRLVNLRQFLLEDLYGIGGAAVVVFGELAQRLKFVDGVAGRAGAVAGERLLDTKNFTLHASPHRIPRHWFYLNGD